MARKQKDIKDEINDMIKVVHSDCLNAFFSELYELFRLFDVDEKDDWVRDLVGVDNMQVVRIVRGCYIVSRMSEKFSSKFSQVRQHFPEFHKRLEEYVKNEEKILEEFEMDEKF